LTSKAQDTTTNCSTHGLAKLRIQLTIVIHID